MARSAFFIFLAMFTFLAASKAAEDQDAKTALEIIREQMQLIMPRTLDDERRKLCCGDNFFEEWYTVKKKKMPYFALTGNSSSSKKRTQKYTKPMLPVDVGEFKRVVTETLIDGYLMFDGYRHDDAIDLSHFPSKGEVHIRTNTQKELNIVLKSLKRIAKKTMIKIPNRDERPRERYKKTPLVNGEVHPNKNVIVHLDKIIKEFKQKKRLALNESIKWNTTHSFITYVLRPAYVQSFLQATSITRGYKSFYFHQSTVIKQIKLFKDTASLNKFESIFIDTEKNTVFYELTKINRTELMDIIRFYDKRPRFVIASVKLLSVSENVQRAIGAAFGYEGAHGYTLTSIASTLLTGGIDVGASYATLKDVVNLTIRALMDTNKGTRYNNIDERTFEFDEGEKSVLMRKQTSVPIVNTFENSKTTDFIEVGLGFEITQIQVIEPDEYQDRLEEIQQRYRKWRFNAKNASLIKKVNLLFQQDNFARVHLPDLDEIVEKSDEFEKEFRKINSLLQIRINATIEDGGIIRLLETENSITPETEILEYRTRQIVASGTPIFLGGTNQKESRETVMKIPFLSDIPGVKHLFMSSSTEKNKDSLVAFLTVTVLDYSTHVQETEKHILGKYGRLGQRIGIPISLGGYAIEAEDQNPMSTGIRSNLTFMYDRMPLPLFYKTKRKLPGGSPIGRKIIGLIFWKEVIDNIAKTGVTSEVEWTSFPLMMRYIDNLHDYSSRPGDEHPFIKAMNVVQQKVKDFSDVAFTKSEILYIVRSEGVVGRYLWPEYQGDDRLFLYLLYIIARETQEDELFNAETLSQYEEMLPELKACNSTEVYFQLCISLMKELDLILENTTGGGVSTMDAADDGRIWIWDDLVDVFSFSSDDNDEKK